MKISRTGSLMGLAATLMGCLLVAALAGRLAANDHQSQTELLLLVQQVSQGTALVAAESKGLLQDSQALVAMQQANDQNIAAFQLLMDGSVKRNLPPIGKFTPILNGDGRLAFDTFQATVSDLIQSRTLLERILRGKDALIQSAERLAAQSESLADGLEQQQPSLGHLRASHRIKSALLTHVQAIRQAYNDGTGAPALPLEELRADLKSLSTDNGAPTSPTIRRTAANLLSQLETHLQSLPALNDHNDARTKLQATQADLQQQARRLQQQLEAVAGALYDYLPWPLYLAIMLTLACLGISAGLGYSLRRRMEPVITVDTSALAPSSHPDRTSPTFSSQLKTEKNLLMNDIKPIGEGILYIKADEHLEATGDLARCLNQSREALARRIDQLKHQVAELQAALASGPASIKAPTPAATSNSQSNAPLIDLTFKGHAELDGLQRHLRNQSSLDKDECKQLLVRCLRAERVLDEIRVRLKKSDVQAIPGARDLPDAPDTADTTNMATVSVLVGKLVDHLNEFQTQPNKPRRNRSLPN